jgi:L-lactate dehydrogenase complex protein LldG
MSARDAILAAVQSNVPRPPVPVPDIPRFAGGRGVLETFRAQLELMGGRSFEVADAAAAEAKLAELFPGAKVVCSAVPEISGTRRIETVRNPHELADVDVGVIRSPLGVAEAGAIWVTQTELIVNALGVLSQHLIALQDPATIVGTIHDAYERIDLVASPYGVFMAGPSATGDIEGVIVHGAQGARSLTVFLTAP